MCHRTPECCAKFYPIFCIVVGVLSIPLWIGTYFSTRAQIGKGVDIYVQRIQILCIGNAIFSVFYFVAGILMFFGIKLVIQNHLY